MEAFTEWTADDAAQCIAVPSEGDDKYSRGVLGVITGSDQYPGAAVLGVEAALRTGVGMVRYLGPSRAADLVLQRRPEAVTANGRVQAWLLGSGIDHLDLDLAALTAALEQPVPVVLDGGAIDLHHRAEGRVVITPHAGEFARLLDVDRVDVSSDPATWARRAADKLGVTVLLKGHTTHVAGPGVSLTVRSAPTWLATAGAGDALGGILGALVATHAKQVADDPAELARLAATAAMLHGLAAARVSGNGPFTILDLAAAIPGVIGELLERFSR
ncbi:MAG: ADP-dependent (S)-NAD(P)H-hydrate dehydratase [Rhodoglobus sp.]|nr:ADP-dependent (S)-NAD(P)H-hydrate dehydratase [Rhodoglobus sp.]